MINPFKRRNILVTHNSGFHADDVFACAIIQMHLDARGEKYGIVRTREENIIRVGDYVFDVGDVYDPEKNRFDHHQHGRAGARDNGIFYAACGLVWKKFGEELSGDKDVADFLDKKVFQALDASDNGQDLSKPIFPGVFPYSMPSIIGIFNPSWTESDANEDAEFARCVTFAKDIIKREIVQAKAYAEAAKDIQKTYEEAKDKHLIILDKPYVRAEILRILTRYSEPVYFVYPRRTTGWKIECVRKYFETFESRKPLPEKWAGLREDTFAKISGVPDATFCHDGRFFAQAKSREGAIALAKKALNS